MSSIHDPILTRRIVVILLVSSLCTLGVIGLPAAAAGSTSVSLSPASSSVTSGNTTTVDVVVDSADEGVRSYNFTVDLDNASVASISAVTPRGDPEFENVDLADDGSSVTVTAAVAETNDTGTVTVATLTIQGDLSGETDLLLSVETLGDENNDAYTVTGENDAAIEVTSRDTGGTEQNGSDGGSDSDNDDRDDDSQTIQESTPTPTDTPASSPTPTPTDTPASSPTPANTTALSPTPVSPTPENTTTSSPTPASTTPATTSGPDSEQSQSPAEEPAGFGVSPVIGVSALAAGSVLLITLFRRYRGP